MDIALSNDDILELTDGEANIVLYPDLHKFETIDELLGPNENCFLLFESKANFGHWVLIFKENKNNVAFFNSYGGYPDDSLKKIPKEFREISNQVVPYLSQLMVDSGYDLSYNEFKFQSDGKNINTCGRWCVLRWWLKDLDLYEFKDFLDYIKDETGLTYDEIVTDLT